MPAERFVSVTFRRDETIGTANYLAGASTTLPESLARGLGDSVTITGPGTAPRHSTADEITAGQALVTGAWIPDPQPAGRPIVVAHRGGPHVNPEHSMLAYRACYAAGIRHIELDCHLLSDGTIGIMHDSTIDRTTNGTGNTVDQTLASWRALRIDTLDANGIVTSESPPVLEDVLDWAIDRDVVLVPEAKSAEVVGPMLAVLAGRRFPAAKVIFQSFTEGWLAPAIAQGYRCILLATNPSETTIATAVAAGYWGVGGSDANLTSTEIALAKSLGLKTWSYTIDRRSEYDAAATAGIEYCFCDDPVYQQRSLRLLSAPLSARRFVPGYVASAAGGESPRGAFQADGTLLIGSTADTSYRGVSLGMLCPIGGALLPSSYTITATFALAAVSTSDQWFGLMFNAQSDTQFVDSAGAAACHQVVCRQSGNLDIYSKLDGVTAVRDVRVSGAALTLGTQYTLTITVTPTTITAALSSGTTAVSTDSRFRGGYVQIGARGATVKVAALSV
ncbi:MAG: glycerophosphodiester phosphodiesterase family protein, partial [Neisseriaceae bacterium]